MSSENKDLAEKRLTRTDVRKNPSLADLLLEPGEHVRRRKSKNSPALIDLIERPNFAFPNTSAAPSINSQDDVFPEVIYNNLENSIDIEIENLETTLKKNCKKAITILRSNSDSTSSDISLTIKIKQY